jgi:hypothetical protein
MTSTLKRTGRPKGECTLVEEALVLPFTQCWELSALSFLGFLGSSGRRGRRLLAAGLRGGC